MTVAGIVPAFVCLGGLVLWLAFERARPLAIVMFAAGLLVWLMAVSDKVVRL